MIIMSQAKISSPTVPVGYRVDVLAMYGTIRIFVYGAIQLA
jgi:hypothetical protein